MNQLCGVDDILAVVSGVVMASADVNFTFAAERIESVARTVEWGCRLLFVIFVRDRPYKVPNLLVAGLGHFCEAGVAGGVLESGKGQADLATTSLVIESQRVGSERQAK